MNTSTHLSQWHGRRHGWPAPLSSQVNRWLWLSLAVSLSIPTTFAFRHVHSQTIKNAAIKNSMGGSETFGVALGIVAGLYSTFLLILSRKEHRLTAAEDGMRDIEDARQTARMRSTISLLIIAVCQSFLAALFLYIGVRIIFLLRASAEHTSTLRALFAYGDFAFVVGQMGLMVYVVFCCVLHEAQIETYLSVQESIDSGETTILMSQIV